MNEGSVFPYILKVLQVIKRYPSVECIDTQKLLEGENETT